MNEKESMMIPEHCSSESEFVEGYGKKELLNNGIFTLIGLVLGLVIFIFTKQLISLVLATVILTSGGYIFCKKDRYSRSSLVDSLTDMYKFKKSQKLYEYRRDNNV